MVNEIFAAGDDSYEARPIKKLAAAPARLLGGNVRQYELGGEELPHSVGEILPQRESRLPGIPFGQGRQVRDQGGTMKLANLQPLNEAELAMIAEETAAPPAAAFFTPTAGTPRDTAPPNCCRTASRVASSRISVRRASCCARAVWATATLSAAAAANRRKTLMGESPSVRRHRRRNPDPWHAGRGGQPPG